MVNKRKLSNEEKVIASKVLINKIQEKEWNEYQLEYHDLMLKSGLNMNHKKNIRDFKAKRREFEQELRMINSNISILKDQIRNGVEVKEIKEEKKNGDN